MLSAHRGDPMLGTAFPASRVLLVEQPGGWGAAGLAASNFDPTIAKRLIGNLGLHGVRVLAIRRPGRTAAPQRRSWGFADCRPGFRAVVWGTFDNDRELLLLDPETVLAGRVPTGEELRGPAALPVFAVCAHGTHDVCCAIQGRPIAAALERLRPGQVWECSHVGGDRFAANVLVLPDGQLYGRVPESAVDDVVAAAESGRVVAELLRGQVGLAPAVQAALAYVHRSSGPYRIADLVVRAAETAPDGTEHVHLSTPAGRLTVTVAVESGDTALLTCRAVAPSTPLVYRPVSAISDAGSGSGERQH